MGERATTYTRDGEEWTEFEIDAADWLPIGEADQLLSAEFSAEDTFDVIYFQENVIVEDKKGRGPKRPGRYTKKKMGQGRRTHDRRRCYLG